MTKNEKQPFDANMFLAKVSAARSVATYKPGRVIFAQGEPGDAVFYIRKGKVKLVVLSQRGKQAVTAILGDGDFLGEGCLAGQPLRKASAIATSDCSIVRLEKTATERALRRDPAFAEVFLSYVLARNCRIEEDLVDQLFNSSEKRLARVLLLLANFGQGDAPADPVRLKISQETLAEMVGTTRPRVSFFMNKFRKLGLIDYKGGIEVRSGLLNMLLRE